MRLTRKLEPPYERVLGTDYVYTSDTRLTPSFASVEQKLGQLEDIEDRLEKYKDIGINGLIDLFKNLTDEDIEYIVQLAFKEHKIIYETK